MGTSTRIHTFKVQGHWPPWSRRFLAALAKGGTITQACAAARIERSTPYHYRMMDLRLLDAGRITEEQSFAVAWAAALEQSADRVEEELRRWALEGVPVIKTTRRRTRRLVDTDDPSSGYIEEETVTVEESVNRSPATLIFLAKALRPARYRESLRPVTDDDLDATEQQLRALGAGGGGDPAPPGPPPQEPPG